MEGTFWNENNVLYFSSDLDYTAISIYQNFSSGYVQFIAKRKKSHRKYLTLAQDTYTSACMSSAAHEAQQKRVIKKSSYELTNSNK